MAPLADGVDVVLGDGEQGLPVLDAEVVVHERGVHQGLVLFWEQGVVHVHGQVADPHLAAA